MIDVSTKPKCISVCFTIKLKKKRFTSNQAKGKYKDLKIKEGKKEIRTNKHKKEDCISNKQGTLFFKKNTVICWIIIHIWNHKIYAIGNQ